MVPGLNADVWKTDSPASTVDGKEENKMARKYLESWKLACSSFDGHTLTNSIWRSYPPCCRLWIRMETRNYFYASEILKMFLV